MRLSSLLAGFVLHGSASFSILGVEPPNHPALNWQAAFTALSAENQASRIVLLVVTNDDASTLRQQQTMPSNKIKLHCNLQTKLHVVGVLKSFSTLASRS